jgi:RimJ/RimL family protein N-acetyltransferase
VAQRPTTGYPCVAARACLTRGQASRFTGRKDARALHSAGAAPSTVRLSRGRSVTVRLRPVELVDLDVYARMRCDPVMMAELGGAQPREGLEATVLRDVRATGADQAWILMIVLDEYEPPVTAGTVALYTRADAVAATSEIGWMVLPEFQGRGVGKAAVRSVLQRASSEKRWGIIHARTTVSNAPSNAICRSLGFVLVGQEEYVVAGRPFQTNHWTIDPQSTLQA